MQEIKYQQLKNELNDDNEFNENNQYQNENENNTSISTEYKIPWVLKLIFLCFVIIKIVYIISNYESIMNWFKPYENQKEFNENLTTFYWDETTEKYSLDYDLYELQLIEIVNTNSTSLPNESNLTSQSYKETTKELYEVTTEIENIFTNNHKHDLEATAIISLINYFNGTTTTEISPTIKDDNNRILPTTLFHANHTSITLQTTKNELLEKTTMMTPPIKYHVLAPVKKAHASRPPVIDLEHKYFINTSRCHIPFVDPFSSETRAIFKPSHSTGCNKDKPIISVSYNDVDATYILRINYAVAQKLRKKSNITIEDDVLCCYQEIIRSGSGTKVDASFKLLPCTNFHQNFVVPLHIQGIIVICKSKSTKSTLQQDAFSFIQINKTVVQNKLPSSSTNVRRKPSVLMIGIDTLSRINFRRNMPEMHKYLIKMKWHELMGYNKVGDNTLPNLMPLLAGYTRSTTYAKCKPWNVGGFDNCNFMWTKFKKHGYYTGYAEDSTTITTFNYHLKGFKNPPTDYYFRPVALAIEKSLKTRKNKGLAYCVGRKQFGEYIYDYGLEFATRFQNHSSFGFFWTNSFSHNSYDLSATMDKTMVNYFKEMDKRGIFENSVVIFFSDHGARWGPLLKLSEGFLEERLPMFFISMPKWFQQEHPDFMRNLKVNQQRLVTPFDIHMTLQHLLKLGEPSYNITPAYDCPKCQTIFEEIPENRTCNDASIPESWCTCIPFKIESTKSKTVRAITNLVIEEMNQYYVLKNLTSICSPLTLKEITMAKQHYRDEFQLSSTSTYVIDFLTNPKTNPKTLFSATVDYDMNSQRIHVNVEDISRQSKYENTAKCTDDKQAKKYCICKTL